MKENRAREKNKTIVLLVGIGLAFLFWYLVFGAGFSIFWLKISVASLVLAIYGTISLAAVERDRSGFALEIKRYFTFRTRHILIGVGSAVFLYAVFLFGNWFLTSLFPSAEAHISDVYATGGEIPLVVIGLLLFFVTSPAEELFWRGCIQRLFTEKSSPWWGLLLATLFYTLVHVWTLNPVLLLAAFIAGAVWGIIFMIERSLIPAIISHALWTVAIFVVLPVG
jgi:membrane protease YdiL (CAAX protease family)